MRKKGKNNIANRTYRIIKISEQDAFYSTKALYINKKVKSTISSKTNNKPGYYSGHFIILHATKDMDKRPYFYAVKLKLLKET